MNGAEQALADLRTDEPLA